VHSTCVEPDEQAGAKRFRNSAGARLVGVMLGEGRTGIVLGHQLGGDLCEWMPMARDLADRGYRVLAIDFGGFGESESADYRRTLREDILAATTQLRRAGSDRVVLIGSSMGGTAVVAAAPAARIRVSAVVSLSGPAQFAGLDAVAAPPGS
jgi:pimeloyl-ACP methyl ester carboxylesterase